MDEAPQRAQCLAMGALFAGLWVAACYGLSALLLGGELLHHLVGPKALWPAVPWVAGALCVGGWLLALARRGFSGRPSDPAGAPLDAGLVLALPMLSLACLASALDPRPLADHDP